MATMTLVEYAKGLEKTDIRKPIIEVFAASSDIFSAIPFTGFSGAAYETYQEAEMPTGMAFRGINEPSSTGMGRITPKQEASFPLDWDADVDRAIIDRHGMGRRSIEEKLSIKRAGRLWASTFIDGDNTSEPREFNGLKQRCAAKGAAGTTNSRLFHNSASSGGAALSLAKLDEMLNDVKGVTHLIMPRRMKTLWIAAARSPTLTNQVVDTGFDEVGRPRLSYAGIPFLFGYEREPEGDLLNFDEVASGGGSAVTASIYAVRFNEDGLHGIELVPMSVEDVGLLQNRITFRTHLKWDTGLADEHPYCCGRLTSITNAAIVA